MSKKIDELRDRLRTYLDSQNLRITKVRFNVVEALAEMGGHFDADTLYFHIRQKGMAASRATVYRTLELLTRAGIVRRITTEGQALYETADQDEHHDHMFCTSCSRIIEFYSEELERLQDEICRDHRFRPTRHSLRIWGMCRDCAR